MSDLVLGIDIGTSATKGCLVDHHGEIIATAERAHGTAMPKPGWFEHDAVSVWRDDFVSVCRELLAANPKQPAAVCTSGIGPCLLPATATGEPLRPAILYGIDTRATAEIDELDLLFGVQEVLRRGGSPLTSQAIGPKLLWLSHHEPSVWEQCRRFFMASSYLVFCLTGEYVLDHHSASQCDPLYDLEAGSWAEDWVMEIAPRLELPRLVWPGEVVGRVNARAAEECGLSVGTPVLAGTIDAWSEAVSVDVREPGDLMLMYGSTMFLIQIGDSPSPDPRMWTTRGITAGRFTLAGGMATSGALTAWLRDIVGAVDFDGLIAEAKGTPPGSDGIVVLPYLAGERTPLFDPRARGMIFGLNLSHGRGHLYRALMEGTAYGVRHNLEVMAEVWDPPARIAAVGGGTRGNLWTQIVCDVCGIDQELHKWSLGASYGDALMAASAVELTDESVVWNPVVTTVCANPDAQETYKPLYEVYRELYPATRTQAHRISNLRSG